MISSSTADLTRLRRRAVLSMMGAMACFVVNDALVKHVSVFMPAPQLIFMRGLMATMLVLVVARQTGAL
ncbi:MAG: hypothetical protein EOP76_20460, partial [Variovorax sp.]